MLKLFQMNEKRILYKNQAKNKAIALHKDRYVVKQKAKRIEVLLKKKIAHKKTIPNLH